MKSLAKCSKRNWRLVRSFQLAWLLVVGLQVSGLTACAEEASKYSKETFTFKKGQQSASKNKNATSSELGRSRLSLPSQRMLDDVLKDLKSVRLIDCKLEPNGRLIGEPGETLKEISSKSVVFESSEPMVLKELVELLRIREGSEFRYNFDGSPTLELTLVDGKVVYLGVIGGGILRWKKWRHDAYLLNTLDFIRWLARHGFIRPARELQTKLDHAIYEYEKEKSSFDEFVKTMPKSLHDFFGTINRLESSACLEDMSEKYGKIPEDKRLKLARFALKRQFSNDFDEIRVLLEWEGKLTNYWASYPSFPIELLLEYDPSQVLAVIKGSSLSPMQWVGVSRYYSNLNFRKKFPSGYKPLDKMLKQRIVKEVKATGKNDSDINDFEYAIHNWLP